jgi:CD109 antigen
MEVYEYLEPGNSNRDIYFLRDVNALDICEVCGSYQCPYCPYYAFSIKQFQSKSFIYSIALCFSFIILNYCWYF